MDPEFWHDRWREGRIGFHEAGGNARLARHFPALHAAAGARIFVPLCGKTRDIGWLLGQGHWVVAVELSRTAVEQLFDELGVEPETSRVGALDLFSAPGLDIFVGDAFDLSAEAIGPVDAIYDRAALVALPEDMRTRYAALLQDITGTAPQLLVCLEYDQSRRDGPPFSITEDEVSRLYSGHYEMTLLERGAAQGAVPMDDAVWLLQPRD